MTRITLLTKPDCALCDHAKQVVVRVAADHPLTMEEIPQDCPDGQDLALEHGVLFAPGILLDGEPFGHGRLSERKLRRALSGR